MVRIYRDKQTIVRIVMVLLVFINCKDSLGQFTTKMLVQYSKNVKDSFEIYISIPDKFNLQGTYNTVYYCDANLKSGKSLREHISTSHNEKLNNYIFVGIGHIGNYHVLRRRDFILPSINNNDTLPKNKMYGHIEDFYSFLKEELMPFINKNYKTNKTKNSIIGHSLGGLFVFYSLFKNDNLFEKYFALSPALWVDYYSIYKFNNIKQGFSDNKLLYFSAGSLEIINRILAGANEAKEFLDEKKYPNLKYIYEVHQNKTHNSQVPISMDKILNNML